MRNLFIFIFIQILLLSCSKDESFNDIDNSKKNDLKVKVVKIPASKLRSSGIDDATQDEYLLQFEDVNSFNIISDTLSRMSLDEKLKWNRQYIEISSIVQEYEKAMTEAESYYDRAGGYEEFKLKYSNLYFPEEGEDFGAYMPFKDESSAFIANENGRYMVGDKIESLAKIETYTDLIESGRADVNNETVDDVDMSLYNNLKVVSGLKGNSPDELDKCYASFVDAGTWFWQKGKVGDNSYRHSTGWRRYGDRKIKVNFEKIAKRKYWALVLPGGFDIEWHYEVSFRKKGILGFWYNYRSETTTDVLIEYFNPDGMGNGVTQKMGKKESGWSSHDQWVKCNDYIIRHIKDSDKSWSNIYNFETKEQVYGIRCVYETPWYWATIKVSHRGIGQNLRFAFTNPRGYLYNRYVGDKLGAGGPF